MSTTESSEQGFTGSSNMGGFGYGIGVSVGILLLISVIGLAAYVWTKTLPRPQDPLSNSQEHQHAETHTESCVLDVAGLDEETIKSYPKLRYTEAKLLKKDCTDTCCSICLVDYKGNDSLRLLPNCIHFFHVKCVDHWLRLHPTCPVCRTSPKLDATC